VSPWNWTRPIADVIVRRWQEFSGKVAVLDGDGRAFDELASERKP
jgi:hypothetical protein